MAQVVTRRPVTAEARVRPCPNTCRVSSRQSGTVTGLYPSTPLCPAIIIISLFHIHRRSQWPCGVRRGSALDMGDVVSNPAGGMNVSSCKCCVLPGRGLCVRLITRPEESHRVVCPRCDCEASIISRLWPAMDCWCMGGGVT